MFMFSVCCIYGGIVCSFQVDLATELEQAKSQIMAHASEIAQVSKLLARL